MKLSFVRLYVYEAIVCSVVCGGQELVHSRQQLADDRADVQTAVDNLKLCLRLLQ